MKLGLYQLTDRAYTSVAEVVDIVAGVIAVIGHDDVTDNLDDVISDQSTPFQVSERLFKHVVKLEQLFLVVELAGQCRFEVFEYLDYLTVVSFSSLTQSRNQFRRFEG